MALVAKTCGQSHFRYCLGTAHQSLRLADSVLQLKLMRRDTYFCLKASDKVVFTDKCNFQCTDCKFTGDMAVRYERFVCTDYGISITQKGG